MRETTGFRQADCCYTCKNYSPDYEGEGECKIYITDNTNNAHNKSYADWTSICDNFEKKN